MRVWPWCQNLLWKSAAWYRSHVSCLGESWLLPQRIELSLGRFPCNWGLKINFKASRRADSDRRIQRNRSPPPLHPKENIYLSLFLTVRNSPRITGRKRVPSHWLLPQTVHRPIDHSGQSPLPSHLSRIRRRHHVLRNGSHRQSFERPGVRVGAAASPSIGEVLWDPAGLWTWRGVGESNRVSSQRVPLRFYRPELWMSDWYSGQNGCRRSVDGSSEQAPSLGRKCAERCGDVAGGVQNENGRQGKHAGSIHQEYRRSRGKARKSTECYGDSWKDKNRKIHKSGRLGVEKVEA